MARNQMESGFGFYAECPNNSPPKTFFHHGLHITVFHAEVQAFSDVAKDLLLEKMHNRSIVVLVDSQAAIKALKRCTVTSSTVLKWQCIANLCQVGKQNHSVMPGFLGMQSYMVTKWQTT